MKSYDLIVVGGGFSGIASAISASRQGIKVLLVEKSNCLGGAATNSLVNPFMNNATKINGKNVDLSSGIFKEILKRLRKRNALIWNSHFLEEELKYILNEMMLENNVDLLFHSYLTQANRENDEIKSITLATIDGEITLSAKYYIDATGDGQLAFLSGCDYILGREKDSLTQPMTLCFRVGNVDTDKFYKALDKVQKEYNEAQKTGDITNPRENILVFNTPIKNVLHFNTTRVVKHNPTNPFEKTKAEIIARKQVHEIYDFLKNHADGMENSFLMSTAGEIGVRESRKIVGEYILTENDLLSCTKFDDGVVACNYDLDIHNPEGAGTSHHYFKDGEYYTIPYRAFIPKKIKNMLISGRCISADQGAQASFRIMPTVTSIGEATGTAIGIIVNDKIDNVRNVDIKKLQKILKDSYIKQ
ncbi:MAG: FAD-dependent oxidoreductase [Clostridia bacterium]|nr:FAD-dependent oxidoreductase [Clostridia bacterium]